MVDKMEWRQMLVFVLCFLAVLPLKAESVAVATGAAQDPVTDTKKQDLDISTARYVKDQVDTAMVPLYDMTNFFINKMVQTKYLTYLAVDQDWSTPEKVWEHMQESWDEWLLYGIGFVVCVGVGVVLFVTMVFVAMITPCCRCCGNCGGKVNPREPKDAKCQRIGCGITLFFITCILILGVVCLFVINIRLNNSLTADNSVLHTAGDSMEDLEAFLNHTVVEINNTALVGFINTKNNVFDILESIPAKSWRAIDNYTSVFTNFRMLADFVDDLPELNRALTKTNNYIKDLNSLHESFNSSLFNTTAELKEAIDGCSHPNCTAMKLRLDYLNAEGDYEEMTTDIYLSQAGIEVIMDETNITDEILRINASLGNIEMQISDIIDPYVEEAKQLANEIQEEISKYIVEINDVVDDLDLAKFKDDLYNYQDDITEYADLAYWCIFGLALTLAVICFCNLLGLLHGMMCSMKSPEAGCCSIDKSTGAGWLLTGVGFTFIFYWLYTLLVMILFAAGGLVESEVCRHLIDYNQTKSADVLNIYDSWVQNTASINISVMESYSNCEKNMAVYTAFKLENFYNISGLIDLTDIEKALDDIKSQNFSMGHINIMSDYLNGTLVQIDDHLGLDFESYYMELNKSLTNDDMDDLLSALLDLHGLEGVQNATLLKNVEELHDFYTNFTRDINYVKEVVRSGLQKTSDLMGVSMLDISLALGQSEMDLNLYGDFVTHKFVNDTADGVYYEIKLFADMAVNNVEHDIGKCRPVYDGVTGTIDSVCVQALWPLNGFWFALGWSLFFLIPSIILSFKLATLYRKTLPYRMKSSQTDGGDMGDSQMYDAYKDAAPNQMQLGPSMHQPHPSAMYAADNPMYKHDELECHLPRPQMVATRHYNNPTYASPYNPDPHFTAPPYNPQTAPPPQYQDNWAKKAEDIHM